MDFSKCADMIGKAYEIAATWYSEDKFAHVCRVAEYVDANSMIDDGDKDVCISLALLHDLFEDTDYNDNYDIEDVFDMDMRRAICLLSKPIHMSYPDYIKSIRNTQGQSWREWAYWVKLADMKDHLMQKETMTDYLREKYWEAIPYLL